MKVVCRHKCYICGSYAKFIIADDAVLYREAQCEICKASVRNSDTAKIIVETLIHEDAAISERIDVLGQYVIVEAQASGAIHHVLRKLPHYVSFEFFDDIEPGKYNGETLCNNLEELTFESNSIDLIITQDVLEHVSNPDKAFSEINRVLKVDGHHIFTVPLHESSLTISRTNLPMVYHGDPIRKEGALVTTDWGKDIIEFVDKYGMTTDRNDLHRFFSAHDITNVDSSYQDYLVTPPLSYYRYNSIVFVSRKISDYMPIVQIKMHEYGPTVIEANCDFNVQPNGENAIWVRASNASSATVIVIDDFHLPSFVHEQGELVTAYVPSWLYRFPGQYSIYLYDVKRKVKSNKMIWTVNASQPSSIQLEDEIVRLRRENLNLHKQLELHKQRKTIKFSGWGLSTEHELPWKDEYNWHVFRQTSEDLKTNFIFGLHEDIGIDASNVDTLLWRHWIVAFAIQYAINNFTERHSKINVVECGVGDGMSAYFALKELEFFSNCTGIEFTAHLYDSWEKLRDEDLSGNEHQIAERYKNNSLERVQKNLQAFDSYITYHVGYIPESLQATMEYMDSIQFLHLDLNSATATSAALQHFYPVIDQGGIILFDDYGWTGFAETKEIIDAFFSDKQGILLKLPTGQAMYFLNN